MKKILLSSIAIAMTGLIVSCGPSKEEMEAEAKRVADSIAAVEAEAKRVSDSMAAVTAAEAQRISDSTAAAEAEATRLADSIDAASKGGKKK